MSTSPTLEVRDLTVTYVSIDGEEQTANHRISFDLRPGEVLGLIGESGSGKTTAAKAILRLLPKRSRVGGSVRLGETDLIPLSDREFRRHRWADLALAPQNALSALDPSMRVGHQIIEPMVQRGMDRDEARERAEELLERVGLERRHYSSYPHELSGGMRQRVCIAMALGLRPKVLIADEPTTALDVRVQRDILELLTSFRDEFQLSMVYITHDLGVAAALCDRIAVLYDGQIVEIADADTILQRPAHPYTMGLIRSYPRWDDLAPVSIPGAPPGAGDDLPGCPFAPRCPFATQSCTEALPELADVAPDHLARCIHADQADDNRAAAVQRSTWDQVGVASRGEDERVEPKPAT